MLSLLFYFFQEKFTKIALIIVLITIFVNATLTWERNKIWKDEYTLWSDCIKKAPCKARTHDNLGLALAASGRTEEAISHYQTAIKINPSHYSAYCNLGAALAASGKTEEAILNYQTAIKINPNYDNAYYNLALVLKDQGQIEQAEKYFRETIHLNPYYPDAHNNLGIILEVYQKKYDEAICHYYEELKIQPDNFGTHYNLGIALIKKGEREEAIKHFQKAILLKPNYEPARQALDIIKQQR